MKYYTDGINRKGRHRRLYGWITAVVVLIVLVWLFGFFFGDSEGKQATMTAIEENTALKQQVQTLTEEIEELQSRINSLEDSGILSSTQIPEAPEAPAGIEITPAPTLRPTATPKPQKTSTPKATARASSTPRATED